MPILDSPHLTSAIMTRSASKRLSVNANVPPKIERPIRSARRQIIVIDSDSEEEVTTTYRNVKETLPKKIVNNNIKDEVKQMDTKILDKDVKLKECKVLVKNCDIKKNLVKKGDNCMEVDNNENNIGELDIPKIKELENEARNPIILKLVLTPKKTIQNNLQEYKVVVSENVQGKAFGSPLKNTLKKNLNEDVQDVDKFKAKELTNFDGYRSPSKSNVTPRKKKSVTSDSELSKMIQVTPPKQKKTENNENKLFSPSSLLAQLDLNSSPTKKIAETKYEPKKLFETTSVFQNARKALSSTVPVQMPGREKEHEELRKFIKGHLENKTSGTLYVSGPPGTGKTASLSTILQQPDIISEFKEIYVNCTGIKSSGSIYSRIVKELGLKCSGKSERDYVMTIETYLARNHKMILLVLDELDQLESKNQSVLYTIFEWPSKPDSKLILIGIANALDLTDRILPRLQARCELKPLLMHFAPYSKQQIVEIFTNRLKIAGVLDLFSPVALQMLAGKVAAISGDVRRALDIGRRVVEIVEQHKKLEPLKSIDNNEADKTKVDLKHVVGVLNSVYGTSNNLNDDVDDSFPLQQKIVICTLLLVLKKNKGRDITIGKLHEVYRKVCTKRNLLAVDQAEFAGLCSLIETQGILRISGKKEPRLHKVSLEWDEEEVAGALKDKQLMAMILQDDSVLGK